MTCDCKPCAAGSSVCARVLLLSPKDDFDATRLWRRFAENGVGHVPRFTSTAQQAMRRAAAEPVEQVGCRSCGVSFSMPTYLVAFLRDQRAPTPHCTACQEAS